AVVAILEDVEAHPVHADVFRAGITVVAIDGLIHAVAQCIAVIFRAGIAVITLLRRAGFATAFHVDAAIRRVGDDAIAGHVRIGAHAHADRPAAGQFRMALLGVPAV